MGNKPKKDVSDRVASMPANGRVFAVVVGVETYQARGRIKKVDHARNDAERFAQTLREIFPAEQLDLVELVDDDATIGSLGYEMRQIIEAVRPDDLLIFYYAGHGFFGAGGNRITAYDSNADHVDTTTLLLRDLLFDPFDASDGMRLLVFIDACATKFKESVKTRDVVSSLNNEELQSYLRPDRYTGVFLSCEPGQPSFPADAVGHGVWTYFLLRALTGEDEGALDRDRYLTDRSLRDYLSNEVPRYLREQTEFTKIQRPQAWIRASNTFAIRQVPETRINVGEDGNLGAISFAPQREFFERLEFGRIQSLPGFSKKAGHFVPDRPNPRTTDFVRGLGESMINDALKEVYDGTKSVFGLRRKQINKTIGVGEGGIDTDFFRFQIDIAQDQDDADHYVVRRRLQLREAGLPEIERIDQIFGAVFEEVVVETSSLGHSFENLVEILEDIQDAHGGELDEEDHLERITYTARDGTRLTFDLAKDTVSLGGHGKQSCASLVEHAHRFAFGLTAQSLLLVRAAETPLLTSSAD